MKIAVIGSGIGGLAAACRLAAKGHEVQVFEKNTHPGGKIDEIHNNGFRFDTGPSLFTLPEMVDQLFSDVGEEIPKSLAYKKLEVLCKYHYNSGQILTAYADQEKFLKECQSVFNENPANIIKYLRNAAEVYQITADIFIFNSLNKFKNFLKLSVLNSLLQVYKLKALTTMHKANARSFNDPRLIQMFDRYATYNGSNPYKAPATLNVIAHLENNLGAYFPTKGMYSIVQHIYDLALKKEVKFNFNTKVEEILLDKKKTIGIKIEGQKLLFDQVIVNSDINYVIKNMINNHPLKKRMNKLEPSSSALVFYWSVNRTTPQLDMHNILFSEQYEEEFKRIFVDKSLCEDPSVYIFISSKLVKTDAPEGCENWFVMINVPADTSQDWEVLKKQARKHIVDKINRTLNLNIEEHIKFEKSTTPMSIQENTLSTSGALYGHSSNSIFAAFRRHPNFLNRYKNLFFVGGSVHPGGGIPLCLASAKIVDQEIPIAQ